MCLTIPVFHSTKSNKTGTFADGHLTDALKNTANDYTTDKRVKKKLILVLASWQDQFSSDPSMSLVAGLYKQCQDGKRMTEQELPKMLGLPNVIPEEKKRVEKEETKKKVQQEKAGKAQDRQKKKRAPFDFEKVCFIERFLVIVLSIVSQRKNQRY